MFILLLANPLSCSWYPVYSFAGGPVPFLNDIWRLNLKTNRCGGGGGVERKPDAPKWHPKMASQNGIPKWRPKMASQNGIPKWHPKMASQNSVPKWHPKMASQNGIPKWHPKMASQNGGQPTATWRHQRGAVLLQFAWQGLQGLQGCPTARDSGWWQLAGEANQPVSKIHTNSDRNSLVTVCMANAFNLSQWRALCLPYIW